MQSVQERFERFNEENDEVNINAIGTDDFAAPENT
jgi:hypothetical protein